MRATKVFITSVLFLIFAISVCAQTEIVVDYSQASSIKIEEPRLAHVNITGIDALPEGKEDNLHAWMEYNDDNGVFFKKRVVVNAQGATSLKFPKKNLAIDFCEDEWIGETTTSVTIGDWVKQDAFHLKANWLDSFRGGLAVATAYKLYDDMVADEPHILERAGLTDYSEKVLCHPDGFPCVVSLNGSFYGVYAWQLKKHRRNMGMKKDNPQHVWFQLQTYTSSFVTGDVNWNHIEVRNPKVVTDETKGIIEQFAGYYKELESMNHTLSRDAMRHEIERRYDVPCLIDFIIHGMVTANIDGFGKNAQFFTYDGYKWFVMPYDLDETFGNPWVGSFQFPAEWSWVSVPYSMEGYVNTVPYTWIVDYFWDDLKKRYACLRRSGVLSVEKIMSYLEDWNDRVGEDYYDKEYAMWASCPSNGVTVLDPHWKKIEDWSQYAKTVAYDAKKTYTPGQTCVYNYQIWEAVQTSTGVLPVVQSGYTDTEERVSRWIEKRLQLEDKYLGYDPSSGGVGLDGVAVDGGRYRNNSTKYIYNGAVVIQKDGSKWRVNGLNL